MVSYHLSCLTPMMFLAFTLFILRPELSLDLWSAVLGRFENLRARRLARKNRQLTDKMKKYWVIDMRKLP